MNKDFLRLQLKSAIYKRKADTKASFYYQTGDTILPSRLDITLGQVFTKARHKGRMTTEEVVGEIRGQFKKEEQSPLKQFKPFKISSKIFRKEEFPQLTGWGGLAVSDVEGSATNEEGVAVFNQIEEGVLEVFFVAGKPLPSLILAVCEIVAKTIQKKGRPMTFPSWILK